MRRFILTRTAKTDRGVYGTLKEEFKEPFAVTHERAWHDNKKNISCIPPGRYIMKRAIYGISKAKNKRYQSFVLMNTPGRTGIFLHIGNKIEDSRGCILIGEYFDPVLNSKRKVIPGILGSKKGFKEFMGNIGHVNEAELLIVEAPNA